jgi:hypothetical protein
MRVSRILQLALFLATGPAACVVETPPRFPLREALWVDPDANPLARDPEPYFSGMDADFADQVALRPLSRALAVPLAHEARNVNSLDEVPNSTWFTNRIGWFAMTPAEVARGACRRTPSLDPARGPWLVVAGKSDGGDTGFTIKAPDGHRYLLKLDGRLQPPQKTTGDVVGSRIYYAAGYDTPCNEIVYFPESILQIPSGTKFKTSAGALVPFSVDTLGRLLGNAARRPDGWVRAMASRFIDGKSIGPFRYEGTRPDDPNDVIPHEDRRELRGARLFAAWLDHVDSREQNTLDTVIEEGGRRFVRHHFIDWSDTLGYREPSDALTRRLNIGAGGYLDLDQVFVDFVTLGLLPRPWHHVAPGAEAHAFGYFGSGPFDPRSWRPGYRNPAFIEMTDADALWAARVIARFSDADLAAIVAEARLEDDRAPPYLVRVLAARRDAILRDTFARGSPLAGFAIVRRAPDEPALCFRDLAIAAHVADPVSTYYRVRLRAGERLERELGWIDLHPDLRAPEASCVPLVRGSVRAADVAGAGAPDDDPRRYLVAAIYSSEGPTMRATAGVVVHLVDLGAARGVHLVGIERLTTLDDPP